MCLGKRVGLVGGGVGVWVCVCGGGGGGVSIVTSSEHWPLIENHKLYTNVWDHANGRVLSSGVRLLSLVMHTSVPCCLDLSTQQ